MRKKVFTLLLALVAIATTAQAQVVLNETNFPDANFRAALAKILGINEGDEITEAKIAATTTIDVSSKSIADLKGIEHFTALTGLSCGGNQLTSLDVSKNTALTWLSCGYSQLTSLDVSKNTALTSLGCIGNQLTSLDVSKNAALTSLTCYFNQLTSLDVSRCTALKDLECSYNQLTSLDVSKNTALTGLGCSGNRLTSLDVSQNTALTWLNCNDNQLTSLDVSSKNTALERLNCRANKIKSKEMDALVESLPMVESGKFYVINTKYKNEGNVCTKSQVGIAKGKGWTVYDYNGGNSQEYEGSDPVAEGQNDGDVLQGTVDGITWTYKIISVADKTCQIGVGEYGETAISTSIAGELSIPSTIDGYTVTALGSWSLRNCEGLTSVNIPVTVKNVGIYSVPTTLSSLTVSTDNPTLADFGANIVVERNTKTILAGCNASQIPDGIVAIGDGAFRECVFETTPTFPTSLKTIGEDGFFRCKGLKNLVLPEGIESIEYYGFHSSDIQMLYIPSTLKSLGYYVFNENRDLSEIKVSEDNPVFDSRNNCNAIIRTSTNELVQGCNTTIIPGDIKTLDWGAFEGMISMKEMVIPEGVYDLGDYTFYHCYDLEEITIPSTVRNSGIYRVTFYDCLSLKTIRCYIEDPADLPTTSSGHGPFGRNAYGEEEKTYEQATLYVPYGTKAKYEAAAGWNKFKNIVEMEYVPISFGDRILMHERQVGDTKYELYKAMADSRSRINADGTPFYLTKLSLYITKNGETTEVVIDEGNLYTNKWTDDLSWNWMSPCMMIDLDNEKMYVFSSSKGEDPYYGMEGFVYSSPLNKLAFSRETVFERANFGWYSFFSGVTEDGQPILRHFSYAGYFDLKSTRTVDGTWEEEFIGDINPDDACSRWDEVEKILVVGGSSEQEIDPVDEDDNVDFGTDMNEGDDLNGNVIGDIYYNISDGNGEYSSTEGCIVVKKPTDDGTMSDLEGKDIFGEDFKSQFTGIVFKVPAGKGTVKVNAETTGNMLLKVKIGANDPVEMELNGKLKVTFPYNVSETTYVYIYAGAANEAKGFGAPASGDAALKIYGIEFIRDNTPTSIDNSQLTTGNSDDAWYSLDGKKLNGEPTQKGVYIRNGKKIVK